ncbi:MAG: hypothetical protein QNM02_13200 [Acidimicrobiia bacterium]|nr:hypothetical protein [Acidimicrobiia bacterium]
MKSRTRTWTIIGALVIGAGMIVAPFAFRMFERAPLGGDMIEAFEPYMTTEQVDRFRGYLVEIDAANDESIAVLGPDAVAAGVTTDADIDATFVSITALNTQWADIDDDMTDLIDRMESNVDNYAAVAALPPFPMFPWFFVIPGAAIVAAAAIALARRSDPADRRGRAATWVLLGLGISVAAAPLAFQMFDRAPQGRDMIDDFRPMMTRERVQDVQGYFVTLGAAEGQLRAQAIPAIAAATGSSPDYPAIVQWSSDWPAILADFNPMVAAMSDNVDNYDAVDALPSFDLFPWFFVVPGLLVAGCAAVALRSGSRQRRAETAADEPDDDGEWPERGAAPDPTTESSSEPACSGSSTHTSGEPDRTQKEQAMPQNSSPRPLRRVVAPAIAALVLIAGCGSDDDSSSTSPTDAPAPTEASAADTEAPAATEAPALTEAPAETDAPTTEPAPSFEGDLVGTFMVDAASCEDPAASSGSYFRMLQPDGTIDAGPFIPNADSVCADPTFTGFAPGTDGGLVTGAWQPAPDPAFDDAGEALADAVFEPVPFFAVAFAVATDEAEAVPAISATGGALTGDLSAYTAYYGGSSFNQGAPKPDGTGEAPVGVIDPDTGAFVLDWTSKIAGGSFDGFVGVWHLEGTFEPAS